jgi:hypothetical protein
MTAGSPTFQSAGVANYIMHINIYTVIFKQDPKLQNSKIGFNFNLSLNITYFLGISGLKGIDNTKDLVEVAASGGRVSQSQAQLPIKHLVRYGPI